MPDMEIVKGQYYVVDSTNAILSGPYSLDDDAFARMRRRVGQRVVKVQLHPRSRRPFLAPYLGGWNKRRQATAAIGVSHEA